MVRVALQPLAWFRSAVLLAVAVGLVLPAPARCASCAAGGGDCTMCLAKDAAKISAVRSCCQRQEKAEADVAFGPVDRIKSLSSPSPCPLPTGEGCGVRAHTCGCRLSPVDRTNAPAERQLTVFTSHSLAAMPATLPLVDDAASSIFAAITAFGELPPPVPHRVLHCCWII
jgi:hypothetical protein